MLKKITSAILVFLIMLPTIFSSARVKDSSIKKQKQAEFVCEGIIKNFTEITEDNTSFRKHTVKYNSDGKIIEDTTVYYSKNESGKKINQETKTKNYTYNDDGTLEKIVFSDKTHSDDISTSTTKYVYNNGKLTSETTRTVSEYNNETDSIVYKYDNDGNMSKFRKTGNTETTTIYTYNKIGNLTNKAKKISCNGTNNYIWNYTYQYDSNGNLIKETDGDTTIEYSYNRKGELLKEVYQQKNSDGTDIAITTYTYDNNDNLTKRDFYSEEHGGYTRNHTTIYNYNSNNKLIKETDSYGCDDSTEESTIVKYTYNKSGNLTKKVSRYKRGTIKRTTTNIYDEKGNILKEVVTFGGDESSITTYNYNAKGQLTSVYKGGTEEQKTDYTYNTKGKLIKEISSYKGSENYSYTATTDFTYNSSGNLTKKRYSYKNSDGDSKIKITEYENFEKNIYSSIDYKCYTSAEYFGVGNIYVIDKKFIFTGSAVKPKIYVTRNYDICFGGEFDYYDTELAEGEDYTLSYVNNTKCGTGKVVIRFYTDDMHCCYYSTEVPFFIVPTQVKSLKATTVKNTSIALSWGNVVGASCYKVEKSIDGKTWTTVKTVSTNKLTVSSLKAGTKYQFRVTALDSTKNVEGKVSAVLKTGTLTSAPTVSLKSTKSKTATVTVKKVTGAAKYEIYKSTNGKKWTRMYTTAKTTVTLSKLTGGKTVYVKVRALNAYGKASAYSKVAKVTVKK